MSHWRRRISAVALCVFLGNVHASAASINEPPANSDIESTIAETLPGFWSLHGSILTGPVNYGTAVEPELVWRFEAVITPKEPLYVQEGTRENLILLQPTLKPGDHETLYGIASATFHAGRWSVLVSPENRPFENRGQPTSYSPGRTVVIGSAEEQVELAAAHERAVKALQSKHEAELAALKLERQSALAKAGETHRVALVALEAELTDLKMRNEQALKKATETHRAALVALEAEHGAELTDLKMRNEQAPKKATETHRAALAALEAEHGAELTDLKMRNEQALKKATETHRAALAALEAEHGAELTDLKMRNEQALKKATETHRAALAALAALEAEHGAELTDLKMRNEQALKKATEIHRAALAELNAMAEQHRLEIAQAESLTELAETATQKLGALHAKETERLAATEQLFGARQSAVNDLVAKIGTAQSYRTLLKTVSETESDLFLEEVLRHGLEAGDEAMNEAAWIHLIRTDLEGATNLRPTLDHHAAALTDNARLRAFLQAALADSVRLRAFLQDTLPSISQWANEIVDFSSRYRRKYSAKNVLGQPTATVCGSGATWAPKTAEEGGFVRVRFSTPAWFPEIGVHESDAVGAVSRIILWDDKGHGTEYEVQDHLVGCPGVARFRFDEHDNPVKEVTVVIGPKATSTNTILEIDAISLTGIVLATQ